MNRFFKDVMFFGVVVCIGTIAYKKLLTPKAQEKLAETAAKIYNTAKSRIVEDNIKTRREARLNLINAINKTDEEWSRLGY